MNLEVPLEMVDLGLSVPGILYTFYIVRMQLNPDDYDGATYYFEIVATNEDDVDRDVDLRVGAATKVSVTIPANTLNPTRLKSSAFTPSAGANDYDIRLPITNTFQDVKVYAGRIIVKQVNATKTRIQIPLVQSAHDSVAVSNEFFLCETTSNDYEQPLGRIFSLWKKVIANFADLATGNCWSFEAIIRGNKATATAYAALFNKTDDVMVAGTEVSVLGETETRVQADFADDAGNFDNLDEFEVRIKKLGGGARGYIMAARLYVKLTNLSKAEILYRVAKGRSATASAYDVPHQRTLLDTSLFSSPTIYFEGVGYCPDNVERLFLRDHGENDSGVNGSDVVNSGINFNSAIKIRIRTNSITPTSGNRFYTRKAASTNSLLLACTLIAVQAEYVAPPVGGKSFGYII